MALNPLLFAELEQFGLTNAHLEMLLALCQSHRSWAMTWHGNSGKPLKFELKLYGSMQAQDQVRQMTQLLQR